MKALTTSGFHPKWLGDEFDPNVLSSFGATFILLSNAYKHFLDFIVLAEK